MVSHALPAADLLQKLRMELWKVCGFFASCCLSRWIAEDSSVTNNWSCATSCTVMRFLHAPQPVPVENTFHRGTEALFQAGVELACR